MVRLIPEKTVELYTAFALVDYLGQDTWIWSPTRGEDQDIWTEDLQKFFMLELKAPEDSNNRGITILRDQLDRYVDAYKNKKDHLDVIHPDVIYVLPHPPSSLAHMCCNPWYPAHLCRDPRYPAHMCCNPWYPAQLRRNWPHALAHPNIRRHFADWSYVIRATDLQQLIDDQSTGKQPATCRLSGSDQYSPPGKCVLTYHRGLPDERWHDVEPLGEFLLKMRSCTEPVGTAMRGKSLRHRRRIVASRVRSRKAEPRTRVPILHRDLPLGDLRLRAVETTRTVEPPEQESQSYSLYVGLP